MLSTIVIGFDGSDRALDALVLAEALARPQTTLVACCVHPPEAPDGPLIPPSPGAAGEARRRLQAARSRLAERESAELVSRTASSVARGLHDEVQARRADLLVVGSSHRARLGRLLPGSVTRQALHAAPCAVAVAPLGTHLFEDLRLHEIGIAYDGGPESAIALVRAADLARQHGARLRIVSVLDQVLAAAGWSSAWVYPDVRADLLRTTGAQLASAAEGLPEDVEATTEVIEGSAVQELVMLSSRLDLLVLGSRGYGPVRSALLGTVSTHVAEHAACPVLVVPRGAAEDEAPALAGSTARTATG